MYFQRLLLVHHGDFFSRKGLENAEFTLGLLVVGNAEVVEGCDNVLWVTGFVVQIKESQRPTLVEVGQSAPPNLKVGKMTAT